MNNCKDCRKLTRECYGTCPVVLVHNSAPSNSEQFWRWWAKSSPPSFKDKGALLRGE